MAQNMVSVVRTKVYNQNEITDSKSARQETY